MSLSLLLLSLSFAQDAPAEPTDAAAEEVADAAEAPTGPDRSGPPPVAPSAPLELDDPEVHVIHDGVTVYLVTLPGVRKVEVGVTLRRGTTDMDGWPTPVAKATGELMDIATATRDAEDIESLSALHDMSVWSTSPSTHEQSVYLDVPRGDLEVGLDLLSETVRFPAYPGKEARRYRHESVFYWQAIAPTNLGTVASLARQYAWYDREHPFGAPVALDEYAEVKPKGMRQRHGDVWLDGPIDVIVVGDVTWADVEAPLTEMLEELGAEGEREYAPIHEGPAESRIVAVHLEGAEQAAIRLRLAGPRFDHPDRDIARLVDFALGGHFLSRLNRNLREDKGFTYGSGSRLSSGRSSGTWDISVDVKSGNAVAAMAEIERELATIAAEGVAPQEINSAVGERVQDWNRTRLTASTGFDRYERLLDDEETPAEARARLQAMAEVPLEETRRVAGEWLGEDAARVWVVVGDRELLETPLAEIGLPVTWILAEEAVLGSF